MEGEQNRRIDSVEYEVGGEMNGRDCRKCVHHHVVHLGVEVDDEGYERPIMDHYCQTASGDRKQCIAELEFGCGLYTERIM